MLVYGHLIGQLDMDECKSDKLPIGRRSFVMLRGANGIVTRILTRYSPYYSNKPDTGTLYQ